MRPVLLLLLGLLLQACSEDVPLPEASPLAVERSVIEGLYGAAAGPRQVVRTENLVLTGRGDQRELEISLSYPATGSHYPLVLFSHGNWSDMYSYRRILDHWVSHGYAVVATNHADCCSPVKGIFNSLRFGQYGLVQRRVTDLRQVLQGLDELAQLDPGFADKFDPTRLAVTGHSFGAFTAQQFGGAAALDPDTDAYYAQADSRVAAVIAMNPPGPMFDTITAESWRQLTAPTLVTTGTWDIQPGFWPDWRMHLMSFENSPEGNKYALVTEGADHYLGNLICRTERDHAPQDDALLMLQLVTTAFLDMHLKGVSEAADLLQADKLGSTTRGFARISRR